MASTTAMFELPRAEPAGSGTAPDEKSRLQKVKDEVRALFGHPNSGRTTAQGRRVEKPGDASTAGPSGQREISRHDRVHANK